MREGIRFPGSILSSLSPRLRSGLSSVIIIIIEPREFVALAIDYVVDRETDVPGLPQIARAPMPRPGSYLSLENPSFAHVPRRVSFERIHHGLRFDSGGDDGVNVIRTSIDRQKPIATMLTHFLNGFFDGHAMLCIEFDRRMLQEPILRLLA